MSSASDNLARFPVPTSTTSSANSNFRFPFPLAFGDAAAPLISSGDKASSVISIVTVAAVPVFLRLTRFVRSVAFEDAS